MPGTRKLGRTSDHRKAMLRAMVTFLFETGKIETTATRAKEVRAMAEKMVNCIYNGNVNQRIEAAKNLAKETDVDGAILFAHWGCKGTIGASSLIKSSLEKDGLPTMILDGDGCNPANTSDGQVSTRLQAFIEMLEKAKSE